MLIDFLLTQQADIRPFLHDGNGEPQYGAMETRACRLETGSSLRTVYKNPSGELEEVTAAAALYCTGEKIPPRSEVTVEDATYTVIDCRIQRGFGFSHLEVLLQ